MKHQALFAFACLVLWTGLSILPAKAVVEVVGGNTMAYDCFLAAKAAVSATTAAWGLDDCNAALDQENLGLRDRAGTYINRGVLENTMGDHDKALRDYEEGIRLKPDLGDAYVDRGAALISLKQYDRAMADINHGIDLGLSYPHIAYYNRAVAEELMGQFKESYFDFKHVLELEPNFTQASEQLKNFTVTTIRTPQQATRD